MHIAIVGCGQLARMLALAGWRAGLTFSFLAEAGETTHCVDGLGNVTRLTDGLSGEALFSALGKPGVVTVEREHVDIQILQSLQPFCPVHPSPEAIAISQHRGREKDFLASQQIATAPYCRIRPGDSPETAMKALGFPLLVKTCEQGYDGRGQQHIESPAQLQDMIAGNGIPGDCIAESLVHFSKEVSLIATRSTSGECVFYPLTENTHRDGILIHSIAPAELPSPDMPTQAQRIATRILEALDYVGVLSIEFFVVGDQLLVNELAPRVHNSGHWTQAAGIGSQFENHLRAITGQGLAPTKPYCHTGMINLIGKMPADALLKEFLAKGNVQIHNYNKASRPGRKVGHINAWDIDHQRLARQLHHILEMIGCNGNNRSNPPTTRPEPANSGDLCASQQIPMGN